jgi:DNA-directed RNA polymerase subunit M/transcription elongation factor TFIIS
VHCKPVGNGQAALKYLAPYIHRVAISNRRLVKLTDNGNMETSQVTFQYRVSDTSQIKFYTLTVESFMQRFLQHVLPHGFVKVRYYGFFGASVRPRLVLLQKRLNETAAQKQSDETVQETVATDTLPKILCPKCGHPMLFQRDIQPNTCRAP